MKKAPPHVSPLALELSKYIAGAIRKPLPRAVVERARVHIVDIFGAMISGSRLLPGTAAIKYVRTQGGKAECGVIGTRIVTSAVNAALANGMFGHADETDANFLVGTHFWHDSPLRFFEFHFEGGAGVLARPHRVRAKTPVPPRSWNSRASASASPASSRWSVWI